jgi:hypothetical protein
MDLDATTTETSQKECGSSATINPGKCIYRDIGMNNKMVQAVTQYLEEQMKQ